MASAAEIRVKLITGSELEKLAACVEAIEAHNKLTLEHMKGLKSTPAVSGVLTLAATASIASASTKKFGRRALFGFLRDRK